MNCGTCLEACRFRAIAGRD
ncbi:MAG: hypothetical protein U5K00_00825 [Melioribacteraceae bacterium]|nr:hypothetical protein [Melioribacteraceae bacterium]